MDVNSSDGADAHGAVVPTDPSSDAWAGVATRAWALLECITRAQRDFILDGDAREVFSRLLDDVLALTLSGYGFIGEIEEGADGEPVLRTWAITNIAWTVELRDWFEEHHRDGLVFSNLDTLFGAVIRTGRPVVANDPGTDPRAGGLPPGHPPLDSFVGLPFLLGGRLVGMVGLANRPSGYDQELIARLEPFLTTCSSLIGALRGRRERERSESRLRMSEARTAAILESVVDAVVVIDEHGVIETFNRAAERTFGFGADEVVGRNVTVLMRDDDAAAHDGYLERYAQTGEPHVIGSAREVTGRRRDGSSFPLELSVAEVSIDGRRLYAGTCRDLTNQRHLDQEMRMYASTMEATSDFVGVARPDGTVLAVNRAGRTLVGIDLDGPIEDVAVGDVHVPWSRDLVREVAIPTAIREGSWAGETAFLGADGREIPMSQVIVVTKDVDGEPRLVSTIARDISELKEIERVKSEFVSTVSHELRTPLTSIRGSLGLLSGGILGELPGPVAEMVGLAQTNTERLIRLVNNILDFEKVQAGRLELNLHDVDPVEVARVACDAVRGAAIEATVEIGLVLPAAPAPALVGDTDRLVQVLVNLLGNALKFSPPGERVLVELAHVGSTVEFRVTDHGPGVAPADRERIFEPFHQLDSSDRRQFGGTGLGLAIAKSIADLHGGRIHVEDGAGGGSVFVLAIPCCETAVATAPPASVVPAATGRPDVLVAEDDRFTSLVVRRILEAQGLQCDAAATGEEAVALVRERRPRVLLLDVGLPVADGFDVVAQLQEEGYRTLPLVVYTGRDLTPDERARLHLGETRYLVKSRASEEELATTVSHLLEHAALEAAG